MDPHKRHKLWIYNFENQIMGVMEKYGADVQENLDEIGKLMRPWNCQMEQAVEGLPSPAWTHFFPPKFTTRNGDLWGLILRAY